MGVIETEMCDKEREIFRGQSSIVCVPMYRMYEGEALVEVRL